MSTPTTTTINRIGSPALLLTLAFFIAKAGGYINWSWWLVFLPLYGPLALLIAALLCVGIALAAGTLIVWIIEVAEDRKRARK